MELHLEKLWDRNISLTTRLVDAVTTPMLLKVVRRANCSQQARNPSLRHERHHQAYDTFANAAQEGALKVVLANPVSR